MFKWIKLFGDQYLGFWILGLMLFVVQEIPYIIMPLFKMESNPIMNMQETSMVLEICEKVLGSFCIFLMTFVIQRDVSVFSMGVGINKLGFICAIAVLLLNFFGWGLYFTGHQSIFVMMFFIVVMPPLYYICIGLWRKNWLLLIMGSAFIIVHFIHVLGNLKA